MELIVRDENAKLLGRIGFDKKLRLSDDIDPQLEAIIKDIEWSGIPTIAEKTEGSNTLYFQTLARADSPKALFALREYLINCGYDVEDYYKETVDALMRALDAYEDCEEKQDFIKEIPTMDYLHQTALLETMKKEPRP
jgi:hypothetical protein